MDPPAVVHSSRRLVANNHYQEFTKMTKKLLPLLFLAIAAIAVACGGDEVSMTEVAPDDATGEVSQTRRIVSLRHRKRSIPMTRQPSHPSAESSAECGTTPPTLDPHLSSDTTSSAIVVELYSGLLTLNTDLQLELEIGGKHVRSMTPPPSIPSSSGRTPSSTTASL